jgi:hypothetical protein
MQQLASKHKLPKKLALRVFQDRTDRPAYPELNRRWKSLQPKRNLLPALCRLAVYLLLARVVWITDGHKSEFEKEMRDENCGKRCTSCFEPEP